VTKLLYAAGLDRVAASVGEALLEADALRGFWTWACNLPVLAWFDLNWVAVTGGAAVGVALGAIIFWPIRQLVIAYRKCVHEKVSQNKFFRWLTNFWFIKLLRFIFIGAKAAT
jgi:hypothetical protein